MIKYLYALKDAKTGFLDVMCHIDDTLAVRSLSSAIANVQGTASELWHYADDFELWCVGKYDTDTGIVHRTGYPRFVMSMTDIKDIVVRRGDKNAAS